MRDYDCFGISTFLDKNLKSMSRVQKKWENYVKDDFCPVSKLKGKLFFWYQMIRMNEVLRRAIKGSHISIKDYCKLVDLWLRVLFRIYRPS